MRACPAAHHGIQPFLPAGLGLQDTDYKIATALNTPRGPYFGHAPDSGHEPPSGVPLVRVARKVPVWVVVVPGSPPVLENWPCIVSPVTVPA